MREIKVSFVMLMNSFLEKRGWVLDAHEPTSDEGVEL